MVPFPFNYFIPAQSQQIAYILGCKPILLWLRHCPSLPVSWRCVQDANLARVSLQGANLSGAILNKVDLTDADLTGATLKHAILDGTLFCRTKRPSGREDNSGCN